MILDWDSHIITFHRGYSNMGGFWVQWKTVNISARNRNYVILYFWYNEFSRFSKRAYLNLICFILFVNKNRVASLISIFLGFNQGSIELTLTQFLLFIQACNKNANTFSLTGNSKLAFNNEQDEKIFKLASELLLSDEDCLRKLSSQVLNEASHLTQLNCVLNTLKKIRSKHLKVDMACIEQIGLDDEEESSYQKKEADDELMDAQLNYILDVIRDVFVQHESQISEQLIEVHKLMSISSDDDLIAHLQSQNFELHQEINQLKLEQQLKVNKEKKIANASNGSTGVSTPSSSGYDKKTSLMRGNHHHILTG